MADLNVVVTDLVALLGLLLILILNHRAELQELQTRVQHLQTQVQDFQTQSQDLQKRTRQQTMQISNLYSFQDALTRKITKLDTKFQKKHGDLNHKLTKLEAKSEEQNEQLEYQNQKINDSESMSYRLRRQELDTHEHSIIQQCTSMIEALEVKIKPHNELFCQDTEDRLTDHIRERFLVMEDLTRRMSVLVNRRIDNSLDLAWSIERGLRQEIAWNQRSGGGYGDGVGRRTDD